MVGKVECFEVVEDLGDIDDVTAGEGGEGERFAAGKTTFDDGFDTNVVDGETGGVGAGRATKTVGEEHDV